MLLTSLPARIKLLFCNLRKDFIETLRFVRRAKGGHLYLASTAQIGVRCRSLITPRLYGRTSFVNHRISFGKLSKLFS